MFRPAKIQLN